MNILAAAEFGNGYNIVLLLHILAVIVGFAPLWLTPLLVRLTAGGDKAAADGLDVSILRFSLPGIGLAGILGFGLSAMSKQAGSTEALFKMSQAWISIAVVLWIVLLAVLFFVARPAIKAFRDGNAAARGRIMMATGIGHLILVVMLYLMIFKPGYTA
ncbi:MAG: hypothetical protein NT081_07435 [Actinobacteria bacterium]|nr:hypothetical protein [Actinomycetota bacterium]